MRMMVIWGGKYLLTLASLVSVANSLAHAADISHSFTIPKDAQTALTAYCVDCHGTRGKGNISLTNLAQLKLNERLDILNRVQDQIFHKMMPPASVDQPTDREIQPLVDWVRSELRRHNASKLDERFPYPDAGNYVDHKTLFDGSIREKPFTPARRWLVSPQIFHSRAVEIFKLEGREKENLLKSGIPGLNNPFMLPEHAGVRYYDQEILDGGHLLAMLKNADLLADKQLQAARIKAGNFTPNPKDKFNPKTTPIAFETIVLKKTSPTDDEIRAAIRTQFENVLHRQANESELVAYLNYTRDAIALAGNTEGLRQMLKAVLLESEFVYRLEFGAGKPDQYGRVPLAPQEAAYAIAYALSDRRPDDKLLKAAHSGQLQTKADYEREVLRILNDKTTFAGPIDPSLGLYRGATTTHPKIIRFFREFFGYYTAHKIFKDVKRSDGLYRNADRGTLGTAGLLINEADKLIDWIVTQDKAVFETMLSTEKYFVYHPLDNEASVQQIAKWKQAYELLKDTDWKQNPDQVAKDHDATIRKFLDPKGLPGKSKARVDPSLTRFMIYFENTFGKGRTPFVITPWSFGNHYWYSPLYNLSKMPGRDGQYAKDALFDYHPVQPFPVPNRKGILTHPAWLIAFSSNTHSDPIRRGRWIREKLLAGVVPDVPITVDAKIPENPHMTLRERVHSVTRDAACVKCHSRMNDLGYPFELFDDFGRFRTVEKLESPENIVKANPGNNEDEYKTKPINSTGRLDGTSDPKLDGQVTDAFDLIDRLARSERVRQSIIRHAFRFFMGRNEMLSDSQTLIEADQAYVKSGGSFKAVVVSLLTSDSFIYRKNTRN